MANNRINNEYVQKGYLKAYLANRSIKVVDYDEWEHLCDCIDDAKAADVRENVRGEWEQVVSGCAILMRCNQCKNAISENDFFEICRKVNHGSKLLDFCPNCGADMRGEEDERIHQN